MRRNWIKLYVDQCLRGTMMSELSADARWVWIGLLLMAGDSNVEGIIFLRKGEDGKLVGYSNQTLSELLAVDISIFKLAKRKMKRFKKIAVDRNNVIKVLNWKKYQSEYSRQKIYRSTEEGDNKNCNSSCNPSNSLELDRDKDKEEDKNIYTPEFESFWNEYPRKEGKEDAFITWKNLTKKIQAELIQASPNYADAMIAEKRDKQYCWKPKTFINAKAGRWKDYLEPIEKPMQVGESKYKPTDKEKERQISLEAYRTELLKKYKPEIDKAKREGDFDRLNDIEDTIKTEVAQKSQEL